MKQCNIQTIIGAHLSIKNGFAQTIYDAQKIESNSLQIFTKSNRMWKAKDITSEDIIKFNEACHQSHIDKKNIIIHASYLINLASDKNTIYKQSIEGLQLEIERALQLGVQTIVLHPGSKGALDHNVSLNQVISGLELALKDTDTIRIALETMAGQGNTIGAKLEDFTYIMKHIDSKITPKIGTCVDTCHIFATGYQLDTPHLYNTFWDTFDTLIGIEKLLVIHLNDSAKPYNSHIDRHAGIGLGHVPERVFTMIMKDSRFNTIPKIIETPKTCLEDDYKNIKRLLSYMQQPLN